MQFKHVSRMFLVFYIRSVRSFTVPVFKKQGGIVAFFATESVAPA